ncbi:MAG: proline--tRNA ligase [Endomicrobium sp.]|jgi:prolyl-tRNA synthetase|nr:proline--tRNA ligase [Endomicrobium sp.]
MFFSKLFNPTLRELSSSSEIVSTNLMIKSGMIRKLASGFYEFLPLGLKVIRKIENIIRNEMSAIDGQEIVLPSIFPKNLLDKTNRWDVYGKELFRLKDRSGSEFCLSPTAEEAMLDLIMKNVKSYKQFPIVLYQFSMKFRDEIRPRFGILRSKEFLMKDAYSFHVNEFDLGKYYEFMMDAYKNICTKCGFKFCVVESSSGLIGGSLSHEFVVPSNNGETSIVQCKSCGYNSSVEKAKCLKIEDSDHYKKMLNIEEVFISDFDTIRNVTESVNQFSKKFVKTLVYSADKNLIIALIRGDHEINEIKLQNLLNVKELKIADEQIINSIINVQMKFIGPVNIKKNKNIYVIADLSVVEILNAISGANKDGYYMKNINYKRDYNVDKIADIRKIVSDDFCPNCKYEKLNFSTGIEIGHIFNLGTKYSKLMNAKYIDSCGNENFIFMGCYGLGVTRIVSAIIEQSHDNRGIIWPDNVSPFEVLIIPLDYHDENIIKIVEKIFKNLSLKGIDVLIDDRDETPGVKFNDGDLIGIPYKIIISKKHIKNGGNIEFKVRKDSKDRFELLKPEDVISKILKIFKKDCYCL